MLCKDFITSCHCVTGRGDFLKWGVRKAVDKFVDSSWARSTRVSVVAKGLVACFMEVVSETLGVCDLRHRRQFKPAGLSLHEWCAETDGVG